MQSGSALISLFPTTEYMVVSSWPDSGDLAHQEEFALGFLKAFHLAV